VRRGEEGVGGEMITHNNIILSNVEWMKEAKPLTRADLERIRKDLIEGNDEQNTTEDCRDLLRLAVELMGLLKYNYENLMLDRDKEGYAYPCSCWERLPKGQYSVVHDESTCEELRTTRLLEEK
jgi:hypothetical protein